MSEPQGEVLFEFVRLGNAVKVSAVDPVTNIEVSIVGPRRASLHILKMVAVRKLRWAIARASAPNNK
jgi:hypothetical protein